MYGKWNGPDAQRTLPSTWLSVASGTPIAGWIVGCLAASYLTSWFGRKMTIIILCVIAIIGMIMQCAIRNYWGLMAGRLVNALSMGTFIGWYRGIGQNYTLVPRKRRQAESDMYLLRSRGKLCAYVHGRACSRFDSRRTD